MDRQHHYQQQQQHQQNYYAQGGQQQQQQQYYHVQQHNVPPSQQQLPSTSPNVALLSQSPGGVGGASSAAITSGLQFQMSPPVSTGPHPSFVSKSNRNSPVPKRPSATTNNSPIPNRGLFYGVGATGGGAPPSPNNNPMFSRSAPGSTSSSRRPSSQNISITNTTTGGIMPHPGPSSLSAAAMTSTSTFMIGGGGGPQQQQQLMMPFSSAGGNTVPQPSPATTSSKMICIRVLSALTGTVYPLKLPSQDLLTIKNIRLYLTRRDVANAPIEDQILLLGPPYKVPKDATLQNESTLASLRLGDDEDGWKWVSDDNEEEQQQQSRRSSSQRHLLDQGSFGGGGGGEDTTTTTTISSGGIGGSGAKRLFLFSKKALVGGNTTTVGTDGIIESGQYQPKIVLEPQEIALPTELPPYPYERYGGGTSGTNSPNSGVLSVFQSTVTTASHPHSPLHQALDVYERRFQLIVYQANILKEGCDQRLQSSSTCLKEQRIILMALRAAVSNLSDHRSNATRTMAEFTTEFHSFTSGHVKLLEGFEPQLEVLSNIRLHPSLQTIAKRSGRVLETLLDCVPLEEYRTWAQQCQISHERLQQAFDEIKEMFERIGNADIWQQQMMQDEQFEQNVMQLEQRLVSDGNAVQQRQCQKVEQLTQSHQRVSKVVQEAVMGGGGGGTPTAAATSSASHGMGGDDGAGGGGGAVSSSSSPPGGGVQAAFASLESLSHETSQILPQMQDDDLLLFGLMNEIASMKSKGMQRIRVRLQEISQCQSLIQQFLTSVNILKESLQQQHVNVSSLEHVHLLHEAYDDFLSEVQRRRLYNLAVTTQLTQMMEVIGNMRSEEIKSREQFLRVSGRHLQPPFYEVFCPTLASPPPIFAPQLPPSSIEMDSLPVITTTNTNVETNAKGTDGTLSGANQQHPPESVVLTKDDVAVEGDNAAGAAGDTMTNSAGTPSLKSASSTRSKDDATDTTTTSNEQQQGSTKKDDGDRGRRRRQSCDDDLGGVIDEVAEATEGLIIADEGRDGEGDDDGLINDDDLRYEQTSKLKAERQALLYENLMLRQTLERQHQQLQLQQQSSSHHHRHHSQRATMLSSSPSAPKSFVQCALDELEAEQAKEKEKLEEALKTIDSYETRVKELSEEATDMKTKLTKTQTSLVKAKKKIATLQGQVNKTSEVQQVTSTKNEGGEQQDGTGKQSSSAISSSARPENKLLSDKISHSSFQVGDVGLFMPTGRSKSVYLAFHSNCPHRYLSADSIPPPTVSRPEPPDYILGRIVFIEHNSASGSSGSSTNPYGLPQGTQFFVLTVEILKL